MSDPGAVVSGRERLEDANHVLHGPGGSPARKEVAYAAYVAVIVVGLYGFPLLRALVIAADREAMASALRSPWSALVLVAVVAAVAVAAREAGRVRGPIVAPVPWIDHVVASSIDRWASLRPWFGYSLFAALFAGGLSGLVVGAAFAGARAAGWWILPAGLVVGLLVGLLAGTAWLVGQSQLSPPLPRGDGPWWVREVRRLGVHDLRTQSSRSNRIVGGVQAGDLRAVRLEAARPVTRGRDLRLRHRGPIMTLVARDVLGLRRSPAAAVVGLLLCASAGAALGATLGSTAVPPLVGFLAGLVSHLGFGALSEGLRLEADTVGTPPLFGAPPVRAAAAHLLVPGAVHLVTTVLVGCVTGVSVGADLGAVLPWLVMTTVFLAGGSLLAAYRGRPPVSQFNPVPSPQTVAVWYAFPLILCTLLVGGMVWGATQFPTNGWFVIAIWVAAICLLYAGLNRVQRENLAHRAV
ncbi:MULTISPECIES: hypothetical protein [unclassified Knoellia]|uniref:hypothetical protein n=1 Tax=Knoellia altitudinis TaxID=3404795 RepID=UPI0036066E80